MLSRNNTVCCFIFLFQCRDKLLNFIAILAMLLNGYSIDLSTMAADLKITTNILSNLCREAGCKVTKESVSQGARLKSELKAPLVFPPMRVGSSKK